MTTLAATRGPLLPTPRIAEGTMAVGKTAEGKAAKAWANAVDFEAQFLKTMLEEAYSCLSGEGPLGGEGAGAEAWRSFLLDEHAKGMAGRSGLGIAEAVYRDTLKRMENRNG